MSTDESPRDPSGAERFPDRRRGLVAPEDPRLPADHTGGVRDQDEPSVPTHPSTPVVAGDPEGPRQESGSRCDIPREGGGGSCPYRGSGRRGVGRDQPTDQDRGPPWSVPSVSPCIKLGVHGPTTHGGVGDRPLSSLTVTAVGVA